MAKKSAGESANEIAKRWTPTLIINGYTPISTYFLDNYHRLKPTLTSLEAMLVIHLIRHKWDERHPHPSFATLARRMGVMSATATRNHARSLEKKRYLNRIPIMGESNRFDLRPLFDALERLYLADQEAKQAKAPKQPLSQDRTRLVEEDWAALIGNPLKPPEIPDLVEAKPQFSVD